MILYAIFGLNVKGTHTKIMIVHDFIFRKWCICNVIYIQNDNVRGFIWRENNILATKVRQLFVKIGVFDDRC